MGCDIHLYIESQDKDGWWCSIYRPELVGRNYKLFAILAGVRNEYNITPIAEPRGFPDNVSTYVWSESLAFGEDAHSRSYLTLKELLALDLSTAINQRGVLDQEEFVNWQDRVYKDKRALPDFYCKSVGGDLVRSSIPHKEFIRLLNAWELETGVFYYIECSWCSTYKEEMGLFYSTIVKTLKKLNTDPAKVRIVFWFDN